MKKLLPLFALLLVTGCARHAVVSEWFDRPDRYAPTHEVEVFRTQMPTRPYTELAKLTVDNRANVTEALKTKAREIGADAIIMTGDAGGRSVLVPMGGMMIGRTLGRTGAIAIKFKE